MSEERDYPSMRHAEERLYNEGFRHFPDGGGGWLRESELASIIQDQGGVYIHPIDVSEDLLNHDRYAAEFATIDEAVSYLRGEGFIEGGDGEWSRESKYVTIQQEEHGVVSVARSLTNADLDRIDREAAAAFEPLERAASEADLREEPSLGWEGEARKEARFQAENPSPNSVIERREELRQSGMDHNQIDSSIGREFFRDPQGHNPLDRTITIRMTVEEALHLQGTSAIGADRVQQTLRPDQGEIRLAVEDIRHLDRPDIDDRLCARISSAMLPPAMKQEREQARAAEREAREPITAYLERWRGSQSKVPEQTPQHEIERGR